MIEMNAGVAHPWVHGVPEYDANTRRTRSTGGTGRPVNIGVGTQGRPCRERVDEAGRGDQQGPDPVDDRDVASGQAADPGQHGQHDRGSQAAKGQPADRTGHDPVPGRRSNR